MWTLQRKPEEITFTAQRGSEPRYACEHWILKAEYRALYRYPATRIRYFDAYIWDGRQLISLEFGFKRRFSRFDFQQKHFHAIMEAVKYAKLSM